jgi:hypothetical protein
MVLKNLNGYRINIRAAVRSLWNGNIDYFQFFSQMERAITRGFNQAWAEGAATQGIRPDEYTDKERERLRQEIIQESGFITRFADAIELNSKRNDGKLAPLLIRAELWVEAYNRIVNLGLAYAAKDQKLRWTLHPAEHCKSCTRLNGKVKRASYWIEHDVFPKNWNKLACRGGCHCSLEPTSDPLSKGPLPSLP